MESDGRHEIRRIGVMHPRGRLEANCYLIDAANDTWVLVDSGWGYPGSFDSLKEKLQALSVEPATIAYVILTHTHPDHCGGAWDFHRLYGTKVVVHERELPYLMRYTNHDEFRERTRSWLSDYDVPPEEIEQITGGMARFGLPVSQPDVILNDGDSMAVGDLKLVALPTPGHSPGHCSIYIPDRRLLFGGDLILKTETPNVSLSFYYDGDPLGDYFTSLRSITGLKPGILFPGHGEPFQDLNETSSRLVQHHEIRTRQILEILGGDVLPVKSIAEKVPWSPGGVQAAHAAPEDAGDAGDLGTSQIHARHRTGGADRAQWKIPVPLLFHEAVVIYENTPSEKFDCVAHLMG